MASPEDRVRDVVRGCYDLVLKTFGHELAAHTNVDLHGLGDETDRLYARTLAVEAVVASVSGQVGVERVTRVCVERAKRRGADSEIVLLPSQAHAQVLNNIASAIESSCGAFIEASIEEGSDPWAPALRRMLDTIKAEITTLILEGAGGASEVTGGTPRADSPWAI